MQPNEQPQNPIDYLQEIAPASQNKTPRDKLLPIVIIAGLLTVVVVGVLAMLGSGQDLQSDMTRLSERLQTLQSIADSSQTKIKSSKLRAVNTNLSVFLTNANTNIKKPLKESGTKELKNSKTIKTQENGDKLKATLEEARLNAVFDRVYAKEIDSQLEYMAVLLKQIKARTKSSTILNFLVVTNNQLEPIRLQFTNFTTETD